ncbi:MAG: amidohydrolase family protein [Lentisphaeria bacterium]|nr:amidohydrolase family protein [Lentisphaeria bacterium]
MIIDIHGHLGNINFAPFWQANAATLERYCSESGVDKLCVSASRSIMYDVKEGNLELDKALKETEKLLGYVVYDPIFPESVEDLALLKSNSKFRGVKIHPDYHGYSLDSKRCRDQVEAIADQTPMMLFHVSCMPGTGFSPALTVADIASHHPDTKFVLAHMAGTYQNGNYPYYPNLDSLEKVMERELDNVFVDTAHYLMYVYPGVMEKMYSLAGADHIVFGTDVPLQGPMQMRFAIEAIQALDIPQEDKDKIFFKNAEKILGI